MNDQALLDMIKTYTESEARLDFADLQKRISDYQSRGDSCDAVAAPVVKAGGGISRWIAAVAAALILVVSSTVIFIGVNGSDAAESGEDRFFGQNRSGVENADSNEAPELYMENNAITTRAAGIDESSASDVSDSDVSDSDAPESDDKGGE